MSRQQRASVRGSVKTSAFRRVGRENDALCSPRLRPGSVPFDIVADVPLDARRSGMFNSLIEKKTC